MNDTAVPVQKAVVAALIADAGVKAASAKAPSGAAVFAVQQSFPDVFPRTTIELPQVVPSRETSIDEVFVTLHHFAKGADATLKAGDLAGAVRAALAPALAVAGFRVVTQTFEGSRSIGDPDETVEHVVSTYRFLVGPSA